MYASYSVASHSGNCHFGSGPARAADVICGLNVDKTEIEAVDKVGRGVDFEGWFVGAVSLADDGTWGAV